MKEAVRAGASEAAAQTSPRVTLRPKLARRAPGDDSVSAVGAVGAHAQGHGERSRLQLFFKFTGIQKARPHTRVLQQGNFGCTSEPFPHSRVHLLAVQYS